MSNELKNKKYRVPGTNLEIVLSKTLEGDQREALEVDPEECHEVALEENLRMTPEK